MNLRLSVLDQTPVFDGESPPIGFQRTIELAKRAEELGYYRYWVTEHHDTEQLASSSPEVLAAYLLAKTKKIRIGSGGVLLQHYSPYKVAENFNVLACLCPGRVDLGIGSSPGGQEMAINALQNDIKSSATPFAEKLFQLTDFLSGVSRPEQATARPVPLLSPDVFLLGSKAHSAKLAAQLGLPYVFAQFINGDRTVRDEALRIYKTSFQKTSNRNPEVIIAVTVIVADSDSEAQKMADRFKGVEVRFKSGKSIVVDTLELANKIGMESQESYTVKIISPDIIFGSKQTIREKLRSLQKETHACELIISSVIEDFEQRLYSYQLLIEAMNCTNLN